MTDDVDQMLNSLGSSAVPAPDPAFADALEATLRTAVVASTGSALSVRRVGRWPTTVAAVAFAASIVAIGLVVWQDSPPQQVFVTGATNAEVVMPTGQTIPAVVGLVLPEGSQVVTGVDGWASFGNEELGPNTFAVVDSTGIDKDATLALGAGPSVAITTTVVPTTDAAPASSSSAPPTSGGVATTALVATASSTVGDIGVATSIVSPSTETVTTDTALVTTTRPRGVTPEPPIGTTTTSLVAATTVPVGLPPTTVVGATTSEPDSTTSSTAAVPTTSSTTDDPLDGTGTGTTSTTAKATTTSTTTSSTTSTSTSTSTTSTSTTSTTSTTEARDRNSAT